MSNFEAPNSFLGKMITYGLVPIVSSLYTTWVASVLWSWFITPIFGMNVPSFWLLYGALIFWHHISLRITHVDLMHAAQLESEEKDALPYILAMAHVGLGTMWLLTGWIVHLLVV